MTAEQTSKRVARYAGKILAADILPGTRIRSLRTGKLIGLCWADVMAVAASALTQTQNKSKRMPKAKAKPKRKLGQWTQAHPLKRKRK